MIYMYHCNLICVSTTADSVNENRYSNANLRRRAGESVRRDVRASEAERPKVARLLRKSLVLLASSLIVTDRPRMHRPD